ncbi:helix-turn-helix domain-containing protein [Erwinia sp. BNK-24-b]|uniref:helix-turn-helix domain-containing protein n=1 Tax=unclassified Erwinia TaxID=2622719 RepID=UPI0039BF55A9
MNIATIAITPVLINREGVQQLLGGISRTTFYNKRKEWAQKNTPFPPEVSELKPAKGGALFRYEEVMKFCHAMGFISSEQH